MADPLPVSQTSMAAQGCSCSFSDFCVRSEIDITGLIYFLKLTQLGIQFEQCATSKVSCVSAFVAELIFFINHKCWITYEVGIPTWNRFTHFQLNLMFCYSLSQVWVVYGSCKWPECTVRSIAATRSANIRTFCLVFVIVRLLSG